MSCRYSEEALALYVEGELVPAESLRLENHLQDCLDCRSAVDELLESVAAFKSIRQDMVSAAAITSVRQNVLNEISGIERSLNWGIRLDRWLHMGIRRRYALAGLALIAIVSGAVWLSVRPAQLPEPARVAAVPPAVVLPQVTVEREEEREETAKPVVKAAGMGTAPVVPVRGQPGQSLSSVPEEPKQVVVKLFTDDPNIVIYWLLDQNGGAE